MILPRRYFKKPSKDQCCPLYHGLVNNDASAYPSQGVGIAQTRKQYSSTTCVE